MAQSTGYKNQLIFPPFWSKALAEPPLEWRIWTAIMEIAILAKDRIDVRIILHPKVPITNLTEPIYELEVEGRNRGRKTKTRLKKPREEG